MKSFELEIKKYAEKTRLKAIEREAIRDRVLSYMEYHPLKKDKLALPQRSFLQRGDFIYIPFNSFRAKLFFGVAALILVVGVPFAAERSVPGDVLYVVKTGVNEGIRTQLATSPYEKVTLETKLMERRIGEARLLASEGKLTEAVEAQIAVTVKEHADAVQSGLAEIREDNADEAALAEITFNSALEVQSAVLTESGKNEDASSVTEIINAVNTAREESSSDAHPVTPSFDGLAARIESETTRTYELFETVKESATAEEISDIERRLADINRKITNAKELRTKDETGSTNDMIDSLGLIQKLIAFMTDIDIRETVTLETLVPVELTSDERLAVVTKSIAETETFKSTIEIASPLITEAAISEKTTIGMTNLMTLIQDARRAVANGEVERAEAKSADARAVVEDLQKIVFSEGVFPAPVPLSATGTEATSTIATTTTETVEINESTTTVIIDEISLPIE